MQGHAQLCMEVLIQINVGFSGGHVIRQGSTNADYGWFQWRTGNYVGKYDYKLRLVLVASGTAHLPCTHSSDGDNCGGDTSSQMTRAPHSTTKKINEWMRQGKENCCVLLHSLEHLC
jgi:hypothetical protein